MTVNTVRFLALLLVALALVPAGAHLAELGNKMKLDAADYHTVQQIYRGWAFFGIVIFGALAATASLAVMVRNHPRAFTPAIVGLLCLIGTQVIFWTFTFPTNQLTANWTIIQPNWTELRDQWEYSHAASACLTVAALVALIASVLRESPVHE